MTPLIAKDLYQGYGSTTVFEGLSFNVPYGVTGILGPNGAGKTTLLDTVATARAPISGTLEIRGHDATAPGDLPQIRKEIGYLPQEFGYPRGFTVEEFVLYSAWLRGVGRDDRSQSVKRALNTPVVVWGVSCGGAGVGVWDGHRDHCCCDATKENSGR